MPVLIGIEHQRALFSDQAAQHRWAPQISALFSRADLQLERGKSLTQSLLRQFGNFFIIIVHPANRCVVAWVATLQDGFPLCAAGKLLMQHRESFLFAEYLFEVAQ